MDQFTRNIVDFNQNILGIAQRQPAMLNESEFKISMKCLREEVSEFAEAHFQGDFIGCIDAIVDLRYFAVGVLYKLGLTAEQIEQIDQAVHDANMQKKLGKKAGRGDGVAADAVKPEGWISPEERIAAILDVVKKG